MDIVLDNLDDRLRSLAAALRLRGLALERPATPSPSGGERGRADVLRLRWHLDGPAAPQDRPARPPPLPARETPAG